MAQFVLFSDRAKGNRGPVLGQLGRGVGRRGTNVGPPSFAGGGPSQSSLVLLRAGVAASDMCLEMVARDKGGQGGENRSNVLLAMVALDKDDRTIKCSRAKGSQTDRHRHLPMHIFRYYRLGPVLAHRRQTVSRCILALLQVGVAASEMFLELVFFNAFWLF